MKSANQNSSRLENSEKSGFIRDWNQLKIRINQLEKEIILKREKAVEFIEIKDIDSKCKVDLKSDYDKLRQQLQRTKLYVTDFREKLKHSNPTPSFVSSLKKITEEIENEFSEIKSTQCQLYEALLREEKITAAEVTAIENKIELWSSKSNNTKTVKKNPIFNPNIPDWEKQKTHNLLPEIIEYNKFLHVSKGLNGGWDEYDHTTFLQFRNKHKGKRSFVQDLMPSIPTRTEAEIIEHDDWYREFCRLSEAKRNAISEWKNKKEEIHNERLLEIQESELKELKEAEENEIKRKQHLINERREKKMEVNSWKLEKELMKAEEDERKLRKKLDMAKEEEILNHKKNLQKKQVLEYKRQKEELEREVALIEELERKEKYQERLEATEKIAYFRNRDLNKVKNRVEKQEEARNIAEKEKQHKIEKVKQLAGVVVERDPTRLLKPTKGWKERQKESEKTEERKIFSIRSVPHRAVPTWRTGIS